VFLPFLGSGFVPTDSMPTGLRWFAEYQPFTPVIETLRGLLMGTPIGNSGLLAIIWCAGIIAVGYVWAKKLFNRDPARWSSRACKAATAAARRSSRPRPAYDDTASSYADRSACSAACRARAGDMVGWNSRRKRKRSAKAIIRAPDLVAR